MTISDRDVIVRSMTEPAAFGDLFRRHAPALHRYIARRAGGTVADDVTSETFLTAFQRRRRFDLSRDDARPWLFGIATNLLHRHRTAEARTLRAVARATDATVAVDSTEEVDRALDAQLEVKRIAEDLKSLSAADRDCLLLFAWADFSYEQISDAMNIPVGTVRSRLNRARRKLRASSPTEEGDHERARYAADPA